MTAISQDKHTESAWLTYTKVLLWISPAVIAWGISCVFVFPKLREIFDQAELNLTAYGALWLVPSVLISLSEHRLLLCFALVLILIVLEWRFKKWANCRRVTLNIIVWAVNVAVLIGLTDLLILASVAAPGLMATR